MRKLNPGELKVINDRLRSLYIKYTEVYEEILDHYCTTLENTPELESPRAIAKLNQTFAWSVVKKMEKTRRKASNQQMNKMQLDSLKIWKLNTISVFILLITVAASLSISNYLGTSALISFVGIVGLAGFTLFFIKHRLTINFSFNIWKQIPSNSFSSVIYGRFCLFIGIFPHAFIGIVDINFDRLYFGSDFFTVSNLAVLLLFLHGLSLIKILMDYQAPKLQLPINQ
jgi:hypothetical protein